MGCGSKLVWCTALLCSSWVVLGCGDSSDPGTSAGGTESATSTGTGMMTAATSSTTAQPTTLNTDSAEGGSEETGTPGTGTGSGGANDVLLGGQTQDFVGNDAIPGTDMRIFGMDGVTDVADAEGNFELGPLPPDTPVAIVLDAITVGDIDYVGAVVPERTGTADRSDVVAAQINQTIIDTQIGFLESQDPVPPDLDQAIVIVMVNPFAGGESLADGTVTVTMDPAPAAGTFYAPDVDGNPVLDSLEIGYQILPAAVFFNLPDTDIGEMTVTVAHELPDMWDCAVDFPSWPTVGAHTTFVLVTCTEL